MKYSARSRLHEGIGMHFFKVVVVNAVGCLPQQGFVFIFNGTLGLQVGGKRDEGEQ